MIRMGGKHVRGNVLVRDPLPSQLKRKLMAKGQGGITLMCMFFVAFYS